MVILCHILLKNFFGIWLHYFNNVTSNSLRTNSVSPSLETDIQIPGSYLYYTLISSVWGLGKSSYAPSLLRYLSQMLLNDTYEQLNWIFEWVISDTILNTLIRTLLVLYHGHIMLWFYKNTSVRKGKLIGLCDTYKCHYPLKWKRCYYVMKIPVQKLLSINFPYILEKQTLEWRARCLEWW